MSEQRIMTPMTELKQVNTNLVQLNLHVTVTHFNTQHGYRDFLLWAVLSSMLENDTHRHKKE